jgi:toluene monooxygenase system protein D
MSAKTAASPVSANVVGPVLRAGELANAVIEAAREDNPGKEVVVVDHVAYVRVGVDHECLLNRDTVERHLGRPFIMAELETDLAAIAGQLEVTESSMRFFFNKSF